MVRLRTLVRAIAAASVLTSGMAHGLGLGEITLKSALNQPLDAEIELLEVRDLGSGEVIPSLASPEEFSKAGVDRLYYLTDLKFTPVVKPNGKSVIRVTSSKPVQEPYLNFLVQVLWPNGRLLREYTVLLDPPLYSPQAAASAPQAPVSAPRATGAPRAPQAPAPVRTTAPAGSDTYRTVSNDTLWEIAQRNRTDRVSVPQAMLAFQELNPGAFVDGNINRLKSGQVLRIPTEQQMLERSPREALSQVQAQNQSWRGSRNPAAGSAGARQLDATQRNAAGSAPSKVDATDNLRLVSGEGKASKGADKGGKGDSKAIADTGHSPAERSPAGCVPAQCSRAGAGSARDSRCGSTDSCSGRRSTRRSGAASGGAAARASCREASGTCRSGARSGTGGRTAGTELPRRTAGQPAVVGGDRR